MSQNASATALSTTALSSTTTLSATALSTTTLAAPIEDAVRESLAAHAPHVHPSVVARRLAEHRSVWAPQVRFDPSAPFELTVYDDGVHQAVLGAWLPGQVSRAHEHVGRPGAVLVLQGTLQETTWHLVTDGPAPGRRESVARSIAAGEVRSHGAVHVHALGNHGDDPALALHIRSLA